MEAFINGLACISHHPTIQEDFFFEGISATPTSNFLHISPPNYKDYIPAAAIRRSSHILKMGISAGLMSLGKEDHPAIDAIITGTAMGCFEDTDKFLRSIDENNERMLTPTSFIQSTHNTVAGQLALLIKCYGYNFTYVHQNLSFEYALLDAMMLLQEKETQNVLVGGVDELIPSLCELFERAGHIKKAENLSPFKNSKTEGYTAGEGAAFFQVSSEKTTGSFAVLKGVKTMSQIKSSESLSRELERFVTSIGLKLTDIDLILTGINGDVQEDALLNNFTASVPQALASFKNLCGEYFTASAFALWFSCKIIAKQRVPDSALYQGTSPSSIKHVLILNHMRGDSYSFMCVAAC